MIKQNQGHFTEELEERIRKYFTYQKRFSTIGLRAIAWSLTDFPIVMINFPFVMGSVLISFFRVGYRSSNRLKKSARWLRHPRSRKGRCARLLPPYRTLSARSKIKAFKRMVISPMEEKYRLQAQALNFDKTEETLTETLTSWEKIPNLMEQILTPFCWMFGITFLGLDPKTVILMSRNKSIYHRWEELGSSLFGKVYLRVKWIFIDSIPWTYSFKFIAVGLIIYVLLMAIIEFVSVQIIYRKGVEGKLLEKICNTSRGMNE
jgi:hypothetical protein